MKTITFILLFLFSLVSPATAQHCNTGVLDPRIAARLKNGMQDIPAAIPKITKEQIQKDRKKMDSSYGTGDLHRIEVTAGHIPISVFNSTHEKGLPVIIYYHYGGFILPLLPEMEQACWKTSTNYQAVVFAVDYRIPPDHKYPASVNDSYDAFKWIMKHATEYGGDTARIILMGESSGANLVAVICQRAQREGIAGKIMLQILICPSLDNARHWADHPTYQQYAKGYVLTKDVVLFTQSVYTDEYNLNNPEVSPLLAKDLKGQPPALMITAEFDILRDEDERYVDRLRRAGVQVEHKCFPGQIHILIGLPPESVEIKELTNLIRKAIHLNTNTNSVSSRKRNEIPASADREYHPYWGNW